MKPTPHRLARALLALCALPAALPAQLGPTVKNKKLGLSYKMPKRLERIPLKLGKSAPNLVDRWESIKPLYGKGGAYLWDVKVLEFKKAQAPVTGEDTETKPEGKPTEPGKSREEIVRELMRNRGTRESFADWFANDRRAQGAAVVAKAKPEKNKKRMEYAYYEWVQNSRGTRWLYMAAAYELDAREVAIVAHFPRDLERKMRSTIRRCLRSLAPLAATANASAKKIEGEEFVDLDPGLRRRLLDEALDGIKGFKEWKVLCTRHYIVLYSFDKEDKGRARAFAKDLAKKMDEMQLQYQKYFPPHKGMKKWWSVLRICRNKAEFDRYGGTSGGVIGWFNPGSKELVIFNSKRLGISTDTVAFHEGWHQYANFWFPGAHLHRWFDEGTGDFFGAMKRLGKNRWKPGTSKMRKTSIKQLVTLEKVVPLREIVTWHMSKFYGPGAPNYYAQGWAMVDFFHRGRKSPYWDKSWSKILPTYIEVALATKDTDKAVAEAFQGVDWEKLEESWKSYVKRTL